MPGKRHLHNKWINLIKDERDKARLVVRCYEQKFSINYSNIFSLIVKNTMIILILNIVANKKLHLEQLNVIQYSSMASPTSGIDNEGKKSLMYRLKKISYDLKQAPRQ